jgi:CubicO group peptidase (beta-lactamase class C family)
MNSKGGSLKETLKLSILLALLLPMEVGAQDDKKMQAFSNGLDSIRTALKIPGLSAVVMHGDSMLFQQGFGFADLATKKPVTKTTTFRIASITKTLTSTIVMQLVEQGKLDLNTPVSKYGIDFGNPAITVRHLLTHTSEGEPGSYFAYNGYRYGRLGIVIEKASGVPFYRLLIEQIIQPLGMSFSAPGIPLFTYFNYVKENREAVQFFDNAFTHLAKPYEMNSGGEVVETRYLDEFGAFGGLTSNPIDLCKYSTAIDRNRFLKKETQQQVFAPNRTTNGAVTPYGFGWYTQTINNDAYYWHYGQTLGESGLFVKVPARNLTLVVLANTDKLSQPFPLGDGDVLTSPVGQLFYKYFINEDPNLRVVDYNKPVSELQEALSAAKTKDVAGFYNKELIAQAAMSNVKGDSMRARQLYEIYAELSFNARRKQKNIRVLAAITNVRVNDDRSVKFKLTKPTRVTIEGVGENCSGDFTSWCDYGWIENDKGQVVWEMQRKPAKHAGGANKNQRVVATITIPAGAFKLRYKSDGGHAYQNWDSAPPEGFEWGIEVRDAQK